MRPVPREKRVGRATDPPASTEAPHHPDVAPQAATSQPSTTSTGLSPPTPREPRFPASLQRPFAIIAFDWDGTAVVNRQADASAVRAKIDQLLRLGVYVVVITGTNFSNVDRQLSAPLVGPEKELLFVCTNRGSEVFGFDQQSRPILLWKRTATAEENRLLTEVAERVRQVLKERFGFDVRVITNRLNRRKIDLIPLPEWESPPKSAIGSLLTAVQRRLHDASVAGGLAEVVEITADAARNQGLADARITTDVKHVEVGLSDKGDSIDWLMRNIAQKHDIPAQDVLIAGDEFGPIDGFEGSDQKMDRPSAAGATFVSVGQEPNGVPANVLHLGGGPATFASLLDEQIDLHERQQAWYVVEANPTPAREHEIESLLTVANGYLGTRGSVFGWSPLGRPATFVAGVFTGFPDATPELTTAPDWTHFDLFIEGQAVATPRGAASEHRRVLDMKRGVFKLDWRYADEAGRITHLYVQRIVSLADRHTLAEFITLVPENYSGRMRCGLTLDGHRSNAAMYEGLPSTPVVGPDQVESGKKTPTLLAVRAPGSGVVVALGARAHLNTAVASTVSRLVQLTDRQVVEWLEWEAIVGNVYRIRRVVIAYTSRETAEPIKAVLDQLGNPDTLSAPEIITPHVEKWSRRWSVADVEIDGDLSAQHAARFAIYHLIAAADPQNERASIGARALTGQSYKGHVFWDTDIYMLPFFTLTEPAAARALMMYRHHTLDGARANAREQGYQGALYAWESTDTGLEATPPFAIGPNGEVVRILTGQQEHHISADVAYAVWQYWTATGDDAFFLEAGAEILIETARFWASRVSVGDDGRYHIRKVIGPDEYHWGVDDNAYTNGLARWNLERSAETLDILQARWPDQGHEITRGCHVTQSDSERWRDIARNLYVPVDSNTGLIEQFSGYFGLDQIDLKAYEPRTAPIDVLLGRERVAHSQIIKQPDVLMLLYLLWDDFSPRVRDANFRYYAPRCAQGSSLSPAIHALLAARLGYADLASAYFQQGAEIDLANNQGNASGGVHAGAMGGLWQAMIMGFAGICPRPDILGLTPRLPSAWQGTRFALRWRGRLLRFAVRGAPSSVEVRLDSGSPLDLAVGDETPSVAHLEEGWCYQTSLRGEVWSPWNRVRG